MSKEDVNNNTCTMETHEQSASTASAEKGSQSMPCSESKADLVCQSSNEAGADEKTTTSAENKDSKPDNDTATTNTAIDSSQEGAAGTTSTNDTGSWTAVWDATSQAYYWWNMVTHETTWENPYENKVMDNEQKVGSSQQQQHQPEIYNNNNAYPYAMPTYPMTTANVPSSLMDHSYTYQAYFNKRTGKFQMASDVDRLNPERMSIEERAKRQMQYYFDVDAYMEQRNRERAAGIPSKITKRHLTKKDIERFKKAKQEKRMKRAREWLCD